MAVEVAAAKPAGEDRELRQILDEEIHRLPLKYRAPIVLCYLEGQTHEEAARQLRWPLGTVKGRLARARSLLESRLTRRGIACGTGLAALAAGGAHGSRSARGAARGHLQRGGPDRFREVDRTRRFRFHHTAHPGSSLNHVPAKAETDRRGLRGLGPVLDRSGPGRPATREFFFFFLPTGETPRAETPEAEEGPAATNPTAPGPAARAEVAEKSQTPPQPSDARN